MYSFIINKALTSEHSLNKFSIMREAILLKGQFTP